MENTTFEGEIWKAVPGYEGYYEISDHGNVRSIDRMVNTCIRHVNQIRRKGRAITLKSTAKTNNYKFVILYKRGIEKMCLIHRLVAKAFIPNPENKPTVNHKDFNGANNHVSNLEWCTHKENSSHAKDKFHRGEKVANSKMTEKEVREIRNLKGVMPCRKAAKIYNISDANICDIWNYKIWKHVI